MPRHSRLSFEGAVHHVMFRGINHSTLFAEDRDFEKALSLLERFAKANSILILAYAIMENHLHLLVKDSTCTLSRFAGQFASYYATYYNYKYDRSGNLFQDRFRSSLIDNDPYLLSAMRYIHQNPLEAGLASTMEEYPWSSYPYYLQKNEKSILDKKFILELFKNDIKKFIAFNNEPNRYFDNKILPKNKISDKKLLALITKHYKISPPEITNLPLNTRKEITLFLLGKNARIGQIARLCKIDKSGLYKMVKTKEK